jgi:hypothetical protein
MSSEVVAPTSAGVAGEDPMATITSATVTLRGSVASRVVSLRANGVAVTLSGRSFAHAVPVTADRLVLLTTIDQDGRAETRTVRIESGSVPAFAPVAG